MLVITAPSVPQCQSWNFQLDNWWMESLDYRYHTIHINKHTARYEADGACASTWRTATPGCRTGSTPPAIASARCAGAG